MPDPTTLFLEKVVAPTIGGPLGALNLPAFGRGVYHEIVGDTISYASEEEFWRDALGTNFFRYDQRQDIGRRLLEGQFIRLINFQITEWFPRCPGLFWTKGGYENRELAEQFTDVMDDVIVYSPYGKTRMIFGGRGTIRLDTHEGYNGRYKLLCATSSGNCDAGIPLVVTDAVYSRIRNEINANGSVCAEVYGSYSQLPISENDLILRTPGSELESRAMAYLLNSYHIPRCCIRVESPLLLARREGDVDLQATAWTLFKAYDPESFPYSFTFYSFDPRREESIIMASDNINRYIDNYRGELILTEFDEKVRRLNAFYQLGMIMKMETHSLMRRYIRDDMINDVFTKANRVDPRKLRIRERHRKALTKSSKR